MKLVDGFLYSASAVSFRVAAIRNKALLMYMIYVYICVYSVGFIHSMRGLIITLTQIEYWMHANHQMGESSNESVKCERAPTRRK